MIDCSIMGSRNQDFDFFPGAGPILNFRFGIWCRGTAVKGVGWNNE